MAVIPALLPPFHLERLRSATRGCHQVVPCDGWTMLAQLCEQQQARVAVIDIFARDAGLEPVRLLKRQLPRLAVVAYVSAALDRFKDAFDAGRQDIDEFLIGNQNDAPAELLAAISRAQSDALLDSVRDSLAITDPVVRSALLAAVSGAWEGLTPQRLARMLAVPRRTLALRLARSGFPSPRPLLTWGRLIVAAHLMEDRHRSADRVAATLGFPSGSAFRNSCQRYLHATPTQMRTRGGAQYVLRVLLRQLHESRKPVEPAGRTMRRLALAV